MISVKKNRELGFLGYLGLVDKFAVGNWIGFLKFGLVNIGELEIMILELYCMVLIGFWPRQYMVGAVVCFWFLIFL